MTSDSTVDETQIVEMDERDREYGRQKMDASDVDGTLYDIRAAIEAARRDEIADAGLEDAASDVEAVRGWVQKVSKWACDECGERKSTCSKGGQDLCNECAFTDVR